MRQRCSPPAFCLECSAAAAATAHIIVISFDIRSPREERYLRRAFMAFMKSGGTQQSLFLEAPLCMVVHTAHTEVPYNFYVFRRRFRCFIAAAAIFGAGDRENRDNCSGSRFAKICCSNYRKEAFFFAQIYIKYSRVVQYSWYQSSWQSNRCMVGFPSYDQKMFV